MALKPTIYKFNLAVSNLDSDKYETLKLVVAQHPSESLERMMARVLAFSLNIQDRLTFTKGLSTPNEPDIWCKRLHDGIDLWIDVGEPAVERIKKASRVTQHVKVYSFNSKSNVWWSQCQAGMQALAVEVTQFDAKEIITLAGLVERTMDISLTISGGSIYLACERGNAEIHPIVLQAR